LPVIRYLLIMSVATKFRTELSSFSCRVNVGGRCVFPIQMNFYWHRTIFDRLCGLVVRVLGYRSGGQGSIPGTTRKRKVVGLERGPLSLVSTTEELLNRKVAAPA
jgi:hypothetical protein